MSWQLVSDGREVAFGQSVATETKRDAVVHTLGGVVLGVAPRRESHIELLVDGERLAGGPSRCERWGSEFVFLGAGWRLEAGK